MTTHTKNRTLFLVLSAVSAALMWFFRPNKSGNVSKAANTNVDDELLNNPTPGQNDPDHDLYYFDSTGTYPTD